jgi:hypothetical protein
MNARKASEMSREMKILWQRVLGGQVRRTPVYEDPRSSVSPVAVWSVTTAAEVPAELPIVMMDNETRRVTRKQCIPGIGIAAD